MKIHSFALAAMLALACSSHAAEKPRPRQEIAKQTQKVWTNDDLDQLRSRGLISIVGPEASQASNETQASSTQANSQVHLSRLQDPAWYAQKAADLQAELEIRQAALHAQQTAISLASDRITQPGVAMYQTNAGITPEAGVANLQAQVDEIQNEVNELGELARVNGIPAGALRS